MEILKIHKKAGQKNIRISFPPEFVDKEMDFILGTPQNPSADEILKSNERVKKLFGILKIETYRPNEDDFYK